MPKILVAGIHFPVASARYMANAFTRIGCDVRSVGPVQGNHIWGTSVDPKYIWTPTYTAGVALADYDIKKFSPFFDDWKPDLIVCMDSAFTLTGFPNEFPCPKVLYGVDNHLMAYNREGEWYDHMFLAHHDGPALPVSGPDKTWLPCGYDSHLFTPSPIPMAERKYDVTVIGWHTPERIELVEAMQDAGINVKAGLGAIYEEYRNIYWNSKISLCQSAWNDVGQRVFETAAMGCFIMTNDVPDLKRLNWRDWTEGRIYHSVNEAIEIAKSILDGEALYRQLMGWRSQIWATPHTWDARAQTILDTMEIK